MKKIKQFWSKMLYDIGMITFFVFVMYFAELMRAETSMRLILAMSIATVPVEWIAMLLFDKKMSYKELWVRRAILIMTSCIAFPLFFTIFGFLKRESTKAYIILILGMFLWQIVGSVLVCLIADWKEKRSIEKINEKLLEYKDD